MTSSLSIVIPEQHYIAFGKTNQGHQAFMTLEGTTQAIKDRQKRLQSQADSLCATHKLAPIPSIVIDNTPMLGFEIACLPSNYDRDLWLIKDPRGFCIAVELSNIWSLLNDCFLENKEILEKCVWGQQGTKNVLIPVTSQVYQSAVSNSARVKSRVSLKDIKLGNKITLRDGQEVVYLGSWHTHVCATHYYSNSNGESFFKTTTNKKFFCGQQRTQQSSCGSQNGQWRECELLAGQQHAWLATMSGPDQQHQHRL